MISFFSLNSKYIVRYGRKCVKTSCFSAFFYTNSLILAPLDPMAAITPKWCIPHGLNSISFDEISGTRPAQDIAQ